MTTGGAARPRKWLHWASGLLLIGAGCAEPPATASVPASAMEQFGTRILLLMRCRSNVPTMEFLSPRAREGSACRRERLPTTSG